MTREYLVGSVDDLPIDGRILVTVRNREIGVFNIGGKYYALPNVCIHQNGPLCLGAVSGTLNASTHTDWKLEWVNEGEILVCPWHSMEYDITTGQSLAFPNRQLPTYDVQVKGGQIVLRA